ncbi:MAG TPA: beta-ketoacyl-[acyl-carrier-protein] synthase family protein [Burkholderiales bacterium]|nr:beta-ketoacyl-[acyl-carrier-protein] synthase family protein [Burkholderiales bacterium]
MTVAVITGAGVVSAFGIGVQAFFDGLAEGGSAIGPIGSFDASSFPTRFAGEVPTDIASMAETFRNEHLSGGDTHLQIDAFRDRKVVFGLLAALEAWNGAQCAQREQEAALSIALGLEQAFLEDFAPIFSSGRIDWKAESDIAGANIRIRSHVGLCADLLGKLLVLRGPTFVNASACAAGGLAVAHAASLIQRGAASIVLCGGADSMVNPLGMGGMTRLGAPSPRNEPDACRPFDRRRDGLVIGEGAAMFIVESEERALRRGVTPLARILGWGSTQDAYRVTAPRPDGSAARNAMLRALSRAALQPEAVGYINAHGTGTQLNDVAEAQAICGAFGRHTDSLPVSSIKGAVGHLMAASGAIELAACLMPFQRNLLPGTAHHREKDPLCEINVIGEQPIEANIDITLSNSFGFGGQNASVILGRYK